MKYLTLTKRGDMMEKNTVTLSLEYYNELMERCDYLEKISEKRCYAMVNPNGWKINFYYGDEAERMIVETMDEELKEQKDENTRIFLINQKLQGKIEELKKLIPLFRLWKYNRRTDKRIG